MRMKSAFNHKYIKNEDLLLGICEFSKDHIISKKMHILLYNLAKNISDRGNWSGYTWKEDMISDAYLKCLISIDKFDINKSRKAFSFFTTIIFRFYFDYIKKFKKYKEIVERLESEFKTRRTIELVECVI